MMPSREMTPSAVITDGGGEREGEGEGEREREGNHAAVCICSGVGNLELLEKTDASPASLSLSVLLGCLIS